MIFAQTIHFACWCKTTEDKGYSQHYWQRISVWTQWLSILRILLRTNMLCKRLRIYEWLDYKWLGIHFLFLSKNNKLCFENSSCKLCPLITPQTHPCHGRCLALASWKFNRVSYAEPGWNQEGHVPLKFLVYLVICSLRGSAPKQILLLTWSQNIWPFPNFGYITVVYGLWIKLFLNQSPKYFWNCVWRFWLSSKITQCTLEAISLTPRRARNKHAFVLEWMQ